mmetsp:Transcript_63364/g.137925  ORF Transcript_63364/g.137925 Transcript_63364/m.137925 type:complete len:339 (-) Transcript_63364:76-1092(-)
MNAGTGAAVAMDADLYAVLGVRREATPAEIRKAFHDGALRWHPDKAGNSPEVRRRFQAVSEAHGVLGNEACRQAYDAQLAEREGRRQMHSARGYPGEVRRVPSTPKAYSPTPSPTGSFVFAQAPGMAFPPPGQGVAHGQFFPGPAPGPVYGARVSAPQPPKVPMPQARAELRPTAMELNPQGLDQPSFRASMQDIRALVTFRHAEHVWQPEISEVQWGRMPDAPRKVQVTFLADYAVPRRAGGPKGPPQLDVQRPSGHEALQRAFRAHLEAVASPSIATAFVISAALALPLKRPEIVVSGGRGLGIRIQVNLEGEPSALLGCFANTQRLPKGKDCPLM